MNTPLSSRLSRRRFVQATLTATGLAFARPWEPFVAAAAPTTLPTRLDDLPCGDAPEPVPLPHFPDRLHAFVWRNWALVPVERLATVVGATKADLVRLGRTMGLPTPPRISADQWRRSYLTIIRRNWHLLPYPQLLRLLDWTPDQLAFTLREDDFLYVKLGSHKPACLPLKLAPPDAATRRRAASMARAVRQEFPRGLPSETDPLFGFVRQLASPPPARRAPWPPSGFSPRFCYSYFALYGDPLLEAEADPYPDGYLARLAAVGVEGVWLQAVLAKLAPFPWQPGLSARFQERRKRLRQLVARARRHGIGVWLYLNEPRAMPLPFFQAHPELKGATEGDHATLCTRQPDVQKYLRDAVGSLSRAVPDLAGFFTITGSENLTHCWSHGGGAQCPRCSKVPPAEVTAQVNQLLWEGITAAGQTGPHAAAPPPRLLAWDWGWNDDWAADAIDRLPAGVALMSVSEWSLPIERGGIQSTVGEYSISAVGPGPRATRHWARARQRGLQAIAKIQAGNTWELSAVPYIPAVENVARHAAQLRQASVDGLMLGWTLGGYPSPNLEVVAALGSDASLAPQAAMQQVAERRFGPHLAPHVVTAWTEFSAAFSKFPYHGDVLYFGPQQSGPANLLWTQPTGYRATMVGFPYDDLDRWRGVYPAEIFIAQFKEVADGFQAALEKLQRSAASARPSATERAALHNELTVAEAAAIHFQSAANQARFVLTRQALAAAASAGAARPLLGVLERVLRDELALARRLCTLQRRDSRLGFEASNQYFYVPLDLAEKVLNCRDLLDRWLPACRARWGA